jgi:ribosomal RNA assembly protein
VTAHVRIPMDRVAVLIGPDGEVKRYIEDRSGVTLEIDSKDGSVVVHDETAKDPFIGMRAADIVRAIGRGFSPEHAFALLRDDFYLAVIEMTEYVGKSPRHLQRIRARVIGTNGRTRRLLEELSEAYVSVYGSTVAIIGDEWSMDVCRRAVDMLLSGSEHKSVYGFLEKMRRSKRMHALDALR